VRNTFRKIYQSLASQGKTNAMLKSNLEDIFPRVGFLTKTQIKELEDIIQIKIINPAIFEQALIHKSYLRVEQIPLRCSYERLEFLGDSILSFVLSEHLFLNHSENKEGELTKIRSNLISGNTLAICGKELGLDKYIRLSFNAEKIKKDNVTKKFSADTVESIVAAIYFDSGIENARKFILDILLPVALKFNLDNSENFKSELMEVVQADSKPYPTYEVIDEFGPSHDRMFKIGVFIEGELFSIGEAKNKKDAEKNAAEKALEKYLQNKINFKESV